MAKPDCDDGWIKYAHELDAALAIADFRKGERIILREIFGQVYGPAKTKTATLSPVDVARRCGMDRRHIVRGLTELVARGVLIRVSRGSYAFVKDYERWKSLDGTPLLSSVEMAWCQSAVKIARSYQIPQTLGAEIVPITEVIGAEIVPNGEQDRGGNCPYLGAEIVPSKNVSPLEPLSRTRASERIENCDGLGLGARTHTSARESEPIAKAEPSDPWAEFIAQVGAEFKSKVVTYLSARKVDIEATVGDRLDAYLAALRKASKRDPEPADVHSWCKTVALRIIRDNEPTDGPIKLTAEESGPANTNSRQRRVEAVRRMLASAGGESHGS